MNPRTALHPGNGCVPRWIQALCLSALGVVSFLGGQEPRIPAKGYALLAKEGPFQSFSFDRHPVGDHDILIETLYAGICHSDIHHAHGDWRTETYPMVPGHEIAGRVIQVGQKVTKFKVGDYAGVGCLINACGECPACKRGEEQYCQQRVLTYADKDHQHGGEITRGGYSNNLVVSEKFAIKVPQGADLAKVAPLLCAGITTYSPLRAAHVQKGDRVAVAGFGGLGHMAVQYAVALGAEVTVFDITESKRQDALAMGAARYVNVNRPEDLHGLDSRFRVILSTIPTKYDPAMYVKMLQEGGEMVVVGLPAMDQTPMLPLSSLVFFAKRRVSGSQIGGIPETQEMLDYSVSHRIYPKVEVIPIQNLDEAYRKVVAGEVKFRYVIDMKSLK